MKKKKMARHICARQIFRNEMSLSFRHLAEFKERGQLPRPTF